MIALWLRPSIPVVVTIVAVALAAALFDVREVFPQVHRSRTTVTVIVALVSVLHLATAAGAVVLARRLTVDRPTGLPQSAAQSLKDAVVLNLLVVANR